MERTLLTLRRPPPYSPLRYPGGKGRLSDYVKSVLKSNKLLGGDYAEPYAGGAGVALSLLLTEHVDRVFLNDIYYPLYCFWESLTTSSDEILRLVNDVKVVPDTWDNQKRVISNAPLESPLDVGFAFFFLNRTNRSGVPNAGMIGGRQQEGKWKIDARFNKPELMKRMTRIADYSSRILVFNLDALDFLEEFERSASQKAFAYLDPPYFNKGQHLYENFYSEPDHQRIADHVQNQMSCPWIVTYDDCPEIRQLYRQRRSVTYQLDYAAREYKKGNEILFYSDDLEIEET